MLRAQSYYRIVYIPFDATKPYRSVLHFILRRRLMRLMMSLQPLCIALPRFSAEKTVIKNIELIPATQWKQINSPVLRPGNRECHMFETTTVSSTELRNAEKILLSVLAFYWPQIKVNIYIKLIDQWTPKTGARGRYGKYHTVWSLHQVVIPKNLW